MSVSPIPTTIPTSSPPAGASAPPMADLSGLLPLWPSELADRSLAGQQRICRLLDAALRRERQRGIGGHWAYDVARHAALARARRVEHKRLAAQASQHAAKSRRPA